MLFTDFYEHYLFINYSVEFGKLYLYPYVAVLFVIQKEAFMPRTQNRQARKV